MLACRKLSRHFGAFRAVDAVDLDVRRGEALGIVGPNGAGKTTLFAMLAGALAPSEGEVRYDGADVTRLGAAARCRLGVSRTHQIPRPFVGMSVYENVVVAARHGGDARGEAAKTLAVEALIACGLIGRANQSAGALGLLDRKRLELARALATKPQVLLLDEIGGGLTERELEILVAEILKLKSAGMTIVWIEHILHALLRAIDRLVCMNAGAIIAEGAPAAVMADSAVRLAYLGGG